MRCSTASRKKTRSMPWPRIISLYCAKNMVNRSWENSTQKNKHSISVTFLSWNRISLLEAIRDRNRQKTQNKRRTKEKRRRTKGEKCKSNKKNRDFCHVNHPLTAPSLVACLGRCPLFCFVFFWQFLKENLKFLKERRTGSLSPSDPSHLQVHRSMMTIGEEKSVRPIKDLILFFPKKNLLFLCICSRTCPKEPRAICAPVN